MPERVAQVGLRLLRLGNKLWHDECFEGRRKGWRCRFKDLREPGRSWVYAWVLERCCASHNRGEKIKWLS